MNHTLKVFALVDETPEKVSNNEKSCHESKSPVQVGALISDLSTEPPAPLTPMSSASNKISLNTPLRPPTKKFWSNESDSSQNSNDSSENEDHDVLETLKRKASESPENAMIAAFEKVLTKNQKKKLKKSLDKQIQK